MAGEGKYVVGISSDFLAPDLGPGEIRLKFTSVDISPLVDNPQVHIKVVQVVNGRIPAAEVTGVDALLLLAVKFDADSIPQDGRLAVVARFGVGYDSVDVEACAAAGIAVTITPDGVRRPVATAILGLILALSLKLVQKNRLSRLGAAGFAQNSNYMGDGLVGKTLGSIGLGNIAAEMFRLCAPLGMKFIASDPYADPAVAAELGVELVDLPTLFARSDYLTVNCPLMKATEKIVNAERLATMKSTAYVINTSRGGTVDQAALAAALEADTIAGAAIDVYDPEPPSPDDPIFSASIGEKLIATPHSICWTDECFAGIGASAIASTLAVMRGEVPSTLVRWQVAESPIFAKRLEGYKARFSGGAAPRPRETIPKRTSHDPNSGIIRPNRVKQVLARGGTAFVAAGQLNWTAESIDALVGPSGCDGVWLEGEHGPLDYGELGNLSRACDLWGLTSIARVTKSCDKVDENVIYRHLDGGVQGVVVPHVNTAEEAAVVAAACKYKTKEFPAGRRGMWFSRQGYGVKDYFMQANATTLSVILIEDIEAVRNLDAILAVEGIDVLSVAFADLAQSMGYLHDLQHPEVQRVTREAIQKIVAAGKVAGSTPMSTEQAQEHHALGVRFFYAQPLALAGAGLKEQIRAVVPNHHSLV